MVVVVLLDRHLDVSLLFVVVYRWSRLLPFHQPAQRSDRLLLKYTRREGGCPFRLSGTGARPHFCAARRVLRQFRRGCRVRVLVLRRRSATTVCDQRRSVRPPCFRLHSPSASWQPVDALICVSPRETSLGDLT